MTTFTWLDLVWPLIAGLGVGLLIQFTKDQVQQATKLPTIGYTLAACILIGVVAGKVVGLGWSWPASLVLFPALTFTWSQVYYLFGRGIFKNLIL